MVLLSFEGTGSGGDICLRPFAMSRHLKSFLAAISVRGATALIGCRTPQAHVKNQRLLEQKQAN